MIQTTTCLIKSSRLKASVVERFNRTLKEKMFRIFKFKGVSSYINDLPNIIYAYNHSYHRTIKMRPTDVSVENEDKLRLMYNNVSQEVKFKLELNDRVRISKFKGVFAKGYEGYWTDEIFVVVQRIPRNPVVYRIKDLNNEILQGVFYEHELQKIIKTDDVYKIDHIIRKRIKNGRKEYLIRWLGFGPDFDTWENADNIIK
jgi:Chromo (CHRromatin Organisation MOdifier) domain